MKKIMLYGCLLGLLAGCNKQDSQVVGTSVGAAMGAEIAGKDDTALGAAVGALAGYWAGSKVGDAIEEEKQLELERRKSCERERKYQEKIKKYCRSCRTWKYVDGHYCSICGMDLAVEKYCHACMRTWSPTADSNYCHKDGKRLRYR